MTRAMTRAKTPLQQAALAAVDDLAEVSNDLGTIELAMTADGIEPEECRTVADTLSRVRDRLDTVAKALDDARQQARSS